MYYEKPWNKKSFLVLVKPKLLNLASGCGQVSCGYVKWSFQELNKWNTAQCFTFLPRPPLFSAQVRGKHTINSSLERGTASVCTSTHIHTPLPKYIKIVIFNPEHIPWLKSTFFIHSFNEPLVTLSADHQVHKTSGQENYFTHRQTHRRSYWQCSFLHTIA